MAPVARTPKNATQTYLDISEIRDDVIVLKDGSYRSVLACSSINFDLKSEDEKNAIIFSYQAFLNSLNFPIQILIRSRRINLDNYLRKLGEFESHQQNELIRLQTGEYIEFIRRLIEVVNIMQKTFYIVVPLYPAGLTPTGQSKGLFSLLPGVGKKKGTSQGKFDENKNALKARSSLVAQGLGTIGVRAAELKTQELIELFYEIYNPELQQQEKLTQVGEIVGPAVSAAPEVAVNPSAQPPAAVAAAPEMEPEVEGMNLEEQS